MKGFPISRQPQLQRSQTLVSVVVFVAIILFGIVALLSRVSTIGAAADLTVEIIAAYNLVVDSNVESPSTYAPSVATVAGRFCNVGDTDLTDVQGFIGDGTTPGTYPTRSSGLGSFDTEHPHLIGTGTYAFTHVGGQLGTGDASRYIGTIPAGECRLQYWHFTYPRRANPNNTGVAVWGQTNVPEDDLWLEFDIWGTATGESGPGGNNSATRRMTMRNEISAMANKIRPNPDGRWFNTNTSQVAPGDVITSNGILYTLGNVRHGFDNDGDYVPDYNAWVQPIGDPSYDPSCFRLIRTSGVLTVTRGGGQPDLIIPFDDNDPGLSAPYGGPLYFTNLPSDNTAVDGEVFYTFLALNGPCVTALSPYQEVASGYDNEKFNGDYGAGIPPVVSLEPAVTMDKSSNPDSVLVGQNFTYEMPVANTGTEGAGLPFSTGDGGMPLVISDTIPAGLEYVASSASFSSSQTGLTANILFSTDNGATWTSVEPAAASVTTIQWWFSDTFDPGATVSISFDAVAPAAPATSFIENCADARFGDGPAFADACTVTLIQGTNQIGDFVWQDEDGDGVQDGGEPGIDDVTVTLYWDRNGDGLLDSGDTVLTSTQTAGGGLYSFDNLPDGDYLVVVDGDDSDIPFGYSNTTTETVAVTDLGVGVVGGVFYQDADFGFGPVLALDKQLITSDPANEGEEVSYTIDLTNTRPGDGGSVPQLCTYTIWSASEDAGHTGNGTNDQWSGLNNANAFNAAGPDGIYATTDYSGGSNRIIAGTDFGNLSPAGSVTSVEILFQLYFDSALVNDHVIGELYYLDVSLGNNAFTVAELNNYIGSGNAGVLAWDVTSLFNWDGSEFSGTSIDVSLEGQKVASDDNSIVNLDGMGIRVTTDMLCNDPNDTINPLPLVDTYDADKLQFVSASPMESNVTTGGSSPYANTGTITWDNLGPLYAGQTTGVTVTFLALEPPDIDLDGENDPTTITNTAAVLNATFINGRPTNQITDTVTATLNPRGSVGDTIWNDNGGPGGTGVASDGIQNGDEQGIPGVTVFLCSSSPCNSGNAFDTTTTDANGNYLFEGVADGAYFVGVDANTLPGTLYTQTGDPDEASTCVTCDDEGATFAINNNNGNPADDDDLSLDFGYIIPNTIFGNVWEDNDGDGIQEAGENGISGVTVFLDDCGANGVCGDGDDGATISTLTDANGDYTFSDLPDGNYRVRVDANNAPLGTDWTQTADPDATLDDQSVVIPVSGGNIYGPYDFGYTQTGSSDVGDTLYTDWDGDGIEDAGEEGIANVTVYLYEDANNDGLIDPANDALVATTTTDGTGFYQFTGLPAGNFIVIVDEDDPDLPDNYVQTGDPDEGASTCSVCDGQALVTTDGSTDIDTIDFGYQPVGSSSIGDTVFRDDNRNGVQDATEPGIANILVTLYEDSNNDGIIDGGDAVVVTATTDINGNYLFTELPAGNYLVQVDEGDSDLPVDGFSNPYILSTGNNPIDVTLGTDEAYLDADFGFTAGGVIGDYIWQDNNGDGQPDNNEPGINGITVELWADTDGNGTPDNLLDTDVTANDPVTGNPGYYEFTGLPAGDYVVVIDGTTVPSGFTQTGDPDENSPPACVVCDGQSAVNLALGQVDRSRDFGYQPAGVIGDTVWIDTNGNGVADPDEPGIPGITVELRDGFCIPGSTCPTVETDDDGYYSFGNLSDGSYTVVVYTSDPDFPAGLTQTYDPDEANPCSTCDSRGSVTITSGSSHFDIDFGYQFSGSNSIAGTTYHDDNDNAVQDAPELFIYPGVAIYLWNCGADPSCSSGVTFVGMTTTDANGDYLFDNLSDGNFLVSVNANAPSVIETDPTVTISPTTIHLVTLSGPNHNVVDQDFGFLSPLDLGDLPDSYRTSLADDGPRHVVTNALYLGAGVSPDLDANGQTDANAGRLTGGDDGDGTDDEDGVIAVTGDPWGDGNGFIEVDVVGSGCLIGWIDWDDNGMFDAGGTVGGVSEILVNQFVTDGVDQQIAITSPTTAQFQGTGLPGYNTEMFVRFRLFPPNDPRFGNMTVDANGCPTAVSEAAIMSLNTGRASAGEVEDYEWLFNEPTAVTLTTFNVRNNIEYAPYLLLMLVLSALTLVSRKMIRGSKKNKLMDETLN